MRLLITLAAAALLGSCVAMPPSPATERRADQEAERLSRALEGKTAEKPVSCISLRDAGSTSYYGETTILYRSSSRLVYRNDPQGGCPGLREGKTLVTRSSTGRICRGDFATIVDPVSGFESGACVYGDFTPYRKR